MAYRIRRVHDQEERSLHAGNERGLHAANVEAQFRVAHSGYAHEVFCDDDGLVVSTFVPQLHSNETLPAPEAGEPEPDPVPPVIDGLNAASDKFLYVIIGVLVLAIIARMFWS